MENEQSSVNKIHHHARRAVHAVRAKPYHMRMHLIRTLTAIGGLCVVLLWITLLKHQLAIEPVVKKQEVEKKQVISEGILRVYNKAKGNSTNQNN